MWAGDRRVELDKLLRIQTIRQSSEGGYPNMKTSITAAALGISFALAAAAGPASAAEVKLKMASTYPSKLVQLGSLGKRLEATVEAMSGGDMELKFYEPGA